MSNRPSDNGHATMGGQSLVGAGGGGGAFPGFGTANQPVGPSTGGVAPTAARSDHQHPTELAANLAALALLSAATMNAGTYCYVTTLRAWFKLEPAGASVAATAVRVTALGKAGFLWFRESWSPAWFNQTTWFITSSALAGTDEGDGASAPNAISPQEYRRRHFLRAIPGTETGSVTLNITADLGDNDYVQAEWAVGLRGGAQNLSIVGSQTVVATGAISAATALNRATNTPNSITAGFAWAAHVGRLVRLQGTTTTTAWATKDLGANTGRLSEQSVAGVVGAGFAAAQTVEVVTLTKVPGIHVIGANQVIMSDCSVNPAAITSLRMDAWYANAAFTRCQFAGGANSNAITVPQFSFTACCFLTRTWTVSGVGGVVLCAQVNQSTTGLSFFRTGSAEIAFQSHVSQASTVTLNERTYAHVSGGGSGTIGFFDLAAAQVGVNCAQGAQYDGGAMYGSGNNATSSYVTLAVGASLTSAVAAQYTVTGGGGVVFAGITVPTTELPTVIGPGQQPASLSKFTGVIVASAGGATLSYLADPGTALAVANQAAQQRYPTSQKLAMRLRLVKRAGAVTTNNVTCTLYKNGVATTMLVTILAADAIGTKYVDSAHPILFADGDDFDLRLDDVGADVLAGTLPVSASIEWAG